MTIVCSFAPSCLSYRSHISASLSCCRCSSTPCRTFMRFSSSTRRSWPVATLTPASRRCLWTKPICKCPHLLPWASSGKQWDVRGEIHYGPSWLRTYCFFCVIQFHFLFCHCQNNIAINNEMSFVSIQRNIKCSQCKKYIVASESSEAQHCSHYSVHWTRVTIMAITFFFLSLVFRQHKPASQRNDHWPDPNDSPLSGPGLGTAVLWLLHLQDVMVRLHVERSILFVPKVVRQYIIYTSVRVLATT